MDVQLSPEASAFISREVAAGEYRSATDVVEAAVAMLRDSLAASDEVIRTKIMEGLRDVDEGRVVEGGPAFMAGIRQEIERRFRERSGE